MKNGLFSFYDTVAQEYSAPFMQKNFGLAQRVYNMEIKRAGAGIIPEELELHHVGNFDTETGEVEMVKPSKVSGNVTNFIKDLDNGVYDDKRA